MNTLFRTAPARGPAAVLLAGLLSFAPIYAAVADDVVAAGQFDAMRGRWQAKLAGPATLDRRSPDVAAQLNAMAGRARRMLATMRRPAGDTGIGGALWDDIADFSNPRGLLASGAVSANAGRLLQMAEAYGTPGSPLYHDAALGESIAFGLDWLLRSHYHVGHQQIGNWWDWQIGTPQHLLNVLTLAGGSIPADVQQRCLAAINWYVPDARYKTRPDGSLDRNHLETGANLLDKAQVMILSGMLGKDAARIAAGRDAIGPALDYVTSDDGFYRDGSFIQHHVVPYAGNYGAVALQVYGRLLLLLNDTPWRITDPNLVHVFQWARDSFAPLLIDGAMPDAFRGRKISVPSTTDHSVGRGMVASLAAIADVAPPVDQAALRAVIKGAIQRDKTFGSNYLAAPGGPGNAALPLYELALLKAIQADPAIPAAREPLGARVYPSSDRAYLRGDGFAAVLSMASPRISAFTNGNGENLQGWWTGMGTLALYDAHQGHFTGDYWPTVDIRRLAGTTTDGSGSGKPEEWKMYPNPNSWVGGASAGRYAALGMVFTLREVTGSDLRGRKSWFLLGDRIVALGSGIEGGQGKVETIVENRRLADASGARLLVDGKPLANGTAAGARWAYLADERAGSHIGYVFPQGTALQLERSERSGNWRALHDRQSEALVRNTYQVVAIPQTTPQYAYMLLPNTSEAATRAAAANPGVRIEANDAQAAAVSMPRQGVYAANLWQAGSAPRGGQPYVTSSVPAAVVALHSGRRLRVVVAEPTQRAGVVEVTVAHPVAAVGKLSAGMTVVEKTPRLRLRIDTTGAAGAGFEGEFTLNDGNDHRYLHHNKSNK